MVSLKRVGAVLALGVAMVAGSAMLATAADQTMTGVVTDSACGLHHKMADAKKCTLGCVSHGADYALVVGDKVYKLEGNTDGLKALAAEKAKVTGDVNGMTITVKSVAKG